MVRATAKQPAVQDDDKKDARKKKSSGKPKKVSEAGVWPCKMTGCNKQFAREADLKRHQRTTKSHSMPGFTGSACPQCDATFTRTDALRRHQKSRHNGVIIEPLDANKGEDGEEGGSSGSKDGSRATSPNAKGKGKGRAKKHDPDAPTSLANPGTAGPASGPSSYYRQHTMQNGVIMDPSQQQQQQQFPPNDGPTRQHQPNWPPPPPWAAESSQAQMGTISYHPSQPGYYQPSPYYRQNGPPMSGAPVMQQAFPPQPQIMQQHPGEVPVDQQELGDEDAQGDVEMAEDASPGPTGPVIDPSLDASASAPHPQGNGNTTGAPSHVNQSAAPSTKPVSLEITQAAMQAVLQSSRTSATPDQGMHSNSSSANGHLNAPPPNAGPEGMPESRTITTAKSPFAHHSPVTQPQILPQVQALAETLQAAMSASRSTPMEPMLSEDGEPMLNPEVGPVLSENSMGAILDMLLAQATPPPS